MRFVALLSLIACSPGGGDADGTTSSGSTTLGTTDTGTTTNGGTPAGTPGGTPTYPIPEGWQRVDLNGAALEASVDASIGDDGTIYVSWAEGTDVFASQSTDGGATWDAPVQVDGTENPLVVVGRQPYVHAGPDALWVTFTTTDPTFTVRLYRSELGTLDFVEQPISLGAADFVDYAKVSTDANGDAWVTWISYLGDQIWPAMARENNGFATEDAGALTASQPCECCRNDLFFTSSGTGLLVFRNNDVPYRDIWSMRAPSGSTSFSQNIQVSFTGWVSYSCPMQGPRIAELGNGDLITAWTDPTAGDWEVWTTKSTDDGQSWSGDAQAASFLPGNLRDPAIAADGTDVWITVEDDNGYTLLHSANSGGSFAELERLDAGATAIVEPQVEAKNGMALVVGANAAGEVVLERLK